MAIANPVALQATRGDGAFLGAGTASLENGHAVLSHRFPSPANKYIPCLLPLNPVFWRFGEAASDECRKVVYRLTLLVRPEADRRRPEKSAHKSVAMGEYFYSVTE